MLICNSPVMDTQNPPKTDSTEKTVVARVRRAYLFGLSIIAVVTIGVFLVERASVTDFDESARILNVAGKQRMLSQRIAIFSGQLVDAKNAGVESIAADNLRTATRQFRDAHAWLLEAAKTFGTGGELTQETHAVYFAAPHKLDQRVKAYLRKVDILLETEGPSRKARYNAIFFDATGSLLRSLDAAVSQIEADSRAKVASTKQLQFALMAFVLIVLLAELLFIFRPLARMVEKKTRELAQARLDARHAALHDALTGLPNRRLLSEILRTTLAQSLRVGKPLTVCQVDLDKFKIINDTHGHAVGDAVIRHAADVLRQSTRASDFIARVGGDEFVIVDSMLGGAEGAKIMAERIVKRMAEPFEVEGRECRIGASIGIADFRCDDVGFDPVMARADMALYHAKELGRGQICLYSTDAQESFDERTKAA